MQNKQFQTKEYIKASHLLAILLELDTDTENKIGEYMQSFGIGHFLNNLEVMNLPTDTVDKLQMLKLMLHRFYTTIKEPEPERKGSDE